MILDANQLASIRQHNDEELRRGSRATHGYPARTVQDLLHTVEALKKEKKKWKKLAQDRGKALKAISELASERPD
jgi:acyl-CoA reductase-like NAD-dependent aldehyde dehydrogenase